MLYRQDKWAYFGWNGYQMATIGQKSHQSAYRVSTKHPVNTGTFDNMGEYGSGGPHGLQNR